MRIFRTNVKSAAAIAAAGVIAIALSGCGGVKPATDAAATGGANDTITVGTTDRVINLDPAGSWDLGSYAIQTQVFPYLYAQANGSGDVVPDIAADEGSYNADGSEFTVKLKDGLKFANGHDLTSSDVKFSFDRVNTIKSSTGPSSLISDISAVDAPDPTTVVFHLKTKNNVLIKQILSSNAGPIVDEQVFKADAVTSADDIIKGRAFAGPYELTNFKLNEMAVYKRFDGYEGNGGKAKTANIQVKYYADASNLKLAVANGDIDVAQRTLTPTDITDLGKNANLNVVTGPGAEERYLVFNFKIQPFGDAQSDADPAKAKAVRQTVADLIDRAAIAKDVYKGLYEPMYSYVPSAIGKTAVETLKSTYGDGKGGPDQAKAKKTLADAGITSPVNLSIEYTTDYGAASTDEYAAIKSQLESSGLFTVDLQQTEKTVLVKQRLVTDSSNGAYPAYQLGWVPSYIDADNFLTPIFRKTGNLRNGYTNDQLESLIVAQTTQTDADQRAKTLAQIQDILTQDVPTIPILQGNQTVVTAKSIQGAKDTLGPSYRFNFSALSKA